jgi:hypothetical protein
MNWPIFWVVVIVAVLFLAVGYEIGKQDKDAS